MPAGRLSDSLAALAAATGASIGSDAAIPRIGTKAVRGRMTVRQALDAMLRGTGLAAVEVAPAVYRLVPSRTGPPARAASVRRPPVEVAPSLPQPDIVVTALKRPQGYGDVPSSLTVVPGGRLAFRTAADTRDLLLDAEGMSATNLGPGRNRIFIRGVADSPFVGPSQSTVAVQLDDARVTFDAPDPDLRPVDLERVEILKGPQGPLYGSGALGGILHLVTRRPEMDEASASIRLEGEALAHGGLGGGVEGVANLPLAPGRLALRAVGYDVRTSGWIDAPGGRRDTNAQRTYGGRVGVRWRPSDLWTIDVGVVLQNLNVADSQYVTASDDTRERSARPREPVDNDFREASATVRRDLGSADVVSATSWVGQRIGQTFDAPAAADPTDAEGRVFRDARSYSLLNQEVRLEGGGARGWLVGASYLRAASRSRGTFVESAASTVAEDIHRVVSEYAAFGERTLGLGPDLSATIGARLFRSVAEDETIERDGVVDTVRKTILSPSLALSWKPSPGTIAYARYARAVRPGGLAPFDEGRPRRFDADELGTLDVGVRSSGDDRLSWTASAFHTGWSDVQSDYLLPNGLVSTRNAGRARIVGVEAGADWRPAARLLLSLGASAQDARLTRNDSGREIDDTRLPVTPAVTGRFAASRSFSVGRWDAAVSARANYVGRSRLSFDPEIDRAIGPYALAALDATFLRGPITLSLGIDNLFDATGDTFGFGNPFTIRLGRQYVPLRPRSVSLSLERRF